MSRIAVAAVLGTLAALPRAAAAVYPPRNADPDWPCQQIRIMDLEPGAYWSGPPLDQALTAWSSDPEVAQLATRIAERRVPIGDAKRAIAAFANGAGKDRQTKLTELFAGVFQTLSAERQSVVEGLDRFGKRQQDLAQQIRGDEDALRKLQDDPKADLHALGATTSRVTWETQVFKDRQSSVSVACDVPNTIEQRVFALARIIQGDLS